MHGPHGFHVVHVDVLELAISYLYILLTKFSRSRAAHFGAYRNARGARRRVAEHTRRTRVTIGMERARAACAASTQSARDSRGASMATIGSLSGLVGRSVARARAPLSPRGRLKRIVTPRRLFSTVLTSVRTHRHGRLGLGGFHGQV